MKTNCPGEPPIRIYVLTQNRLMLEVSVRLLRKQSGLTVIGDNHDSAQALEELTVTPCDVLLLDSLDTLRAIGQGAEVAECIRKVKIVLFGMKEDPEWLLKAVRLGVCGYLLNDTSSAELIGAVRAVAQGKAVCPPKLCKTLFEHARSLSQSGKAGSRGHAAVGLTCRQRQLMTLVAKGMTNKEIAANLRLSEFTVKNHLHRIMACLQADSRHKAADLIRTDGLFLSAATVRVPRLPIER